MSFSEYLKVVRRRWPIMLACALAAAAIMWVVTPANPGPVQRVTGYDATATLLVNRAAEGDDQASQVSLDRMALYISTGEVPAKAAEQLGYTGDPAVLASQVTVTPSSQSMSVTLTTSGGDGARVADVANAFAEQSVDFFAQPRDGTGASSLTVLQEATPIPRYSSGVLTVPPSRSLRTALAAAMGLLLGFGLALVVHQVDSRLRTREEVYQAVGMPVIAEIPKFNRTQRESGRILVADEPHGSYADGYRTARAAVLYAASTRVDRRTDGGATVTLVTSAVASEGKTTSIANLAAAFAETGQSVLVLDADLRSPDLHLQFDVPQGAGISDFLYDPVSTRLSSLARPTNVPGVKIITAGTQLAHPASLATRMGMLIEQSRGLADIVLVDTAPILAASDVFDLLPIVDTVLFVVRSGRLTEMSGRRVAEFLGRFNVPVTGAILIGTRVRRGKGYGYGYGTAADDPAASRRAKMGRRRSPPAATGTTSPDGGSPPSKVSAGPTRRPAPARDTAPSTTTTDRQTPQGAGIPQRENSAKPAADEDVLEALGLDPYEGYDEEQARAGTGSRAGEFETRRQRRESLG